MDRWPIPYGYTWLSLSLDRPEPAEPTESRKNTIQIWNFYPIFDWFGVTRTKNLCKIIMESVVCCNQFTTNKEESCNVFFFHFKCLNHALKYEIVQISICHSFQLQSLRIALIIIYKPSFTWLYDNYLWWITIETPSHLFWRINHYSLQFMLCSVLQLKLSNKKMFTRLLSFLW